MDLNKLQDRKKYNDWAKRKNAYSFYDGGKKKKRHKFALVGIISLIILLIAGFVFYRFRITDTGVIYGDLMIVRQRDLGDHEFEGELEEKTAKELAIQYLDTMGIEAKIAQLMITTPELLNGISQVVQAGDATKKKLMQYPVGGLIYSGINFETIEQIEKLINHTKLFTNYPTFLGMEETGTTKIMNTQNDLYQVGINMNCSQSEYLLLTEDEEISVSDTLTINELLGRDPVTLLNNGADMLIIKYSFIANHSKILKGVKSGEITEESIDEKVIKVLEFKLMYGVE